MRTCDQIEIIESAYILDVSDAQWQYRLTDLVAERWGGAAASFLFDASRPSELICERVVVRKAGERSIVDAPQSIRLANQALRHALFRTRPHLVQLVDLLGPELSEAADCAQVLHVVRDLHPGPFSVVLRTLSHSHKGVFFLLPSRPIGDRMRAMWGQVAVHIGLAYRLRYALANAAGAADRSKADPALLRRALRQAGDHVLLSRSSLGVGPTGAGRSVWQGLTASEWSRVDRDGADGDDDAHHRVGQRAQLEGSTLTLNTSSIAEHVATLASKFGVTSPVEIVRLLDDVREPPDED